jgi:hypothetical protein
MQMVTRGSLIVACVALLALSPDAHSATPENERIINAFMHLVIGEEAYVEQAFDVIEEEWEPGFTAMSLDVLSVAPASPRTQRLIGVLEANTGESLGSDISGWYEWLWSEPESLHPAYGDFKSALYSIIDPDFRAYFSSDRRMDIRLDEIRWGGVRQDGIPPLRNPTMISADDAEYLDDSNIVFGLEVSGEARAYPKRILAWHEMFVDEIGGFPVVGVYCTLCGTMILYDTVFDGTNHALGTSGFLYRSNKLMYDRATQSLWNTIWGTPVVGPLAGKGIELQRRSVVTTTWGEWKRRHAATLVLSLDTGYERDYSEGAAYRDYFATDELMFNVPQLDRRLNNKDEVFALRLPGNDTTPLAIASEFLQRNPIYYETLDDLRIVVLTDASGAHRAYEAGEVAFTEWDRDAALVDANGVAWTLDESWLRSATGSELDRLPAHRAFWFGWFSAWPNTRLIH